MWEITSDMLKPGHTGESVRPAVSHGAAAKLVQRLYGLRVTRIEELSGYVDRNYKVLVDREYDNPYITHLSPHGYTLKILNRVDSRYDHVDIEHRVQKSLSSNGIDVIQPVLNIHGHTYSREHLNMDLSGAIQLNDNPDASEDIQSSSTNLVHLLTFLPGMSLHCVPYTPFLMHEAGCLLGRIKNVLGEISYPLLSSMQMIWSLKLLPELKPLLYAVTDEINKQLVVDVISAFELEVMPNMHNFRKGVIHGDFSEQNIIVKEIPLEQQTADDKFSVSTVVDFGHVHEAYFIMDVAVTIMYLMVDNKVMDPLDVGGYVLSGYGKYNKVLPEEFNALKVLVAGRFCQSLVIGAHSYMREPGNEYMLTTAVRGWRVLENLWKTPKQDLYSRWKKIMTSQNRPAEEEI